MASVELPGGGRLRFTGAGLTLARRGGGWLLGTPRIRYVEIQRVRLLLWYLLGGLVACYCALMLLQDGIKPLPGLLGLLAGLGMLTYGWRGTWKLAVYLHDAADAAVSWLPGTIGPEDEAHSANLRKFEESVNAWLREQARRAAEAAREAEEAARQAAREAEAARQAAAEVNQNSGASFTAAAAPETPAPAITVRYHYRARSAENRPADT